MNSQFIVQRTQNTDFSRLDDAYLAIDAQQGYCYSLNATAGRVWDLTDQPIRLADICGQLQKEYTVDEEICRRDVFALVDKLREAGLLQVDGQKETDI